MANPSNNFAAWYGGTTEMSDRTLATLEAVFADDTVFTVNGVVIGSSRAAIMSAIRGAVAAGWTHHNTLSTAVNGDFMVGTYENQYADGSTSKGAALVRFNADNQAAEMVAMAEQSRIVDKLG